MRSAGKPIAAPKAVLAGGVCLLLAYGSALGESTLSGSVTQRGVYDSSPRLSFSETDSIAGYILEPRVSLDFTGERWQVGNDLRLTFPFYGNDDFNLNEQRYDLGVTRFLQRGDFSLTGALERGSTLTNGLVDELDGLINDNNEIVATRRNSAIVRPQWTHRLTERNTMVLGGSMSVVDFEDNTFPVTLFDGRVVDVDAPGQLSDYRFDGADLTLQRALTPRTSIFATAAVSRFQTQERVLLTDIDVLAQETSNFSRQLQLGVTHAFSNTVSGTLRAGARLVDSESQTESIALGLPTQVVEEDSTGGVFDASVRWAPERTLVELAASRSLAPSGVGQLLEQDRVFLTVRREFRPGITGTLRLGYIERARFISGEPFDRQVFRIDPTLRWRVRRHWAVAAGARYAQVEDGSGEDRDGVRLFVNVTYDFSRTPAFR
ncbi:MAG: outer membrane beta-barrel protein [Pseudomonadota bacterium]